MLILFKRSLLGCNIFLSKNLWETSVFDPIVLRIGKQTHSWCLLMSNSISESSFPQLEQFSVRKRMLSEAFLENGLIMVLRIFLNNYSSCLDFGQWSNLSVWTLIQDIGVAAVVNKCCTGSRWTAEIDTKCLDLKGKDYNRKRVVPVQWAEK